MSTIAYTTNADGSKSIVSTDLGGGVKAVSCRCCVGGYYVLTPCGYPQLPASGPCSRPPFASLYISDAALVGNRRMRVVVDEAIAAGNARGGVTEFGVSYAGHCYYIRFAAPTPFGAGRTTLAGTTTNAPDADPTTPDALPPGYVLDPASVAAMAGDGSFCGLGRCAPDELFVEAWPCSGQPNASGSVFVCAAIAGAAGTVFKARGACWCIGSRVVRIDDVPNGALVIPQETFGSCAACVHPPDNCTDSSPPGCGGTVCRCCDGVPQTFGNAVQEGVYTDLADPSRSSSTRYEQEFFTREPGDPNGSPTERLHLSRLRFREWGNDGFLGVPRTDYTIEPLPGIAGQGCPLCRLQVEPVPDPASPGSNQIFNPLGPVFQVDFGSTVNIGQPRPDTGLAYGSAQCVSDCYLLCYTWQSSRLSPRDSLTGQQQGPDFFYRGRTCAQWDQVTQPGASSDCTAPVTGDPVGVPAVEIPADPRELLP